MIRADIHEALALSGCSEYDEGSYEYGELPPLINEMQMASDNKPSKDLKYIG